MMHQVVFLESPSETSKSTSDWKEKKRSEVADWERSKLPMLKKREEEEDAKAKTPKKKGPKGAHPMSCKKRKKVQPEPRQAAPQAQPEEVKKPKRVRSRRMGTRTREE